MKRLVFLFGLVLVFIATTSFGEDSPLVQAAKKEKERRAKIEATKTFTNQDIEAQRSKTQLGMESTSTEESSSAERRKTPEAGKQTPATAEKQSEDKSNNEEYWKERATEAQDKVSAAEEKVQQIQDDVSSLNKSFYIDGNVDAVSQRPLVSDEINKRQEDLDKAKKELEDAKAEREGLEDEARQQGAPPGWVEQ